VVHLPTCKILHITNVYMPNNYWEKLECWDSVLGFMEYGFNHNCIIDGDFNTAMHLRKKRGGSIVKGPSRENMEDLISTLDLIDVPSNKGIFTWNNREHVQVALRLGLISFLFIALFCLSLR
jgi:hypothetical protein